MMGGWQIGDAPRDEPMSYPGAPPPGDALLFGAALRPLRSERGRPPGRWIVPRDTTGTVILDDLLLECGAAPIEARAAVLAVGSNRCAAQLASKLRIPGRPARLGVVPMIRVQVQGVGTGHSAHIGTNGYLSYTPVARPGVHERWLIWLDEDQLEIVDGTEFHYTVVAGAEPLVLSQEPDVRVDDWRMYRSRHGALNLDDGVGPMAAGTQEEIFTRLLVVEWFRALLPARVDSPARLSVALVRHEWLRDSARAAFAAHGCAVLDGLDGLVRELLPADPLCNGTK